MWWRRHDFVTWPCHRDKAVFDSPAQMKFTRLGLVSKRHQQGTHNDPRNHITVSSFSEGHSNLCRTIEQTAIWRWFETPWYSLVVTIISVSKCSIIEPLFPHIITVTSWWAWWRLKSPVSRLFTQPFVQAQMKENIKAPRHWPLWGNSPVTGEFPVQRASDAENVSALWRLMIVS